MLIALVVGVFGLFSVMLSILSVPAEQAAFDLQTQVLREQMQQITRSTQEYASEFPNNGYLSPENLMGITGYEWLRSAFPARFQSATANNLSDSVWQYSRYAIWFVSPMADLSGDYLDLNQCGTGSFASASSWCGHPQSIWSKLESRTANSSLLFSERIRMGRIASKFYRAYALEDRFTDQASGTAVLLAQLAGYSGTAIGCSGVYVYRGIPFTCDELFNYWGNPIVVNTLSAKHMALVNRTGVLNSNGQPIRLAEELYVE